MWILIVTAIVLFLTFLKSHLRHKTPVRAAVANMVAGVAALVLVAPVVSATVNVYTAFIALTLGVPGVALIAVARIFV